MKTSELSGAQLDYWVAKSAGMNPTIQRRYSSPYALNVGPPPEHCWVSGWQIPGEQVFMPSTNWSQGGPIIEREKIDLAFQGTECCAGYNSRIESSGYDESLVEWIEMDFKQFGPTPLIAAMRAYVASKFGETVEDI